MAILKKIGLVLWKNLKLRRRHCCVTSCEIILPTILTIIMVLIVYIQNASSLFKVNGTHKDVLLFTPNNPRLRRIMERVDEQLGPNLIELRAFNTEIEAIRHVENIIRTPRPRSNQSQAIVDPGAAPDPGADPDPGSIAVKALIVFDKRSLNFGSGAYPPSGYTISYMFRRIQLDSGGISDDQLFPPLGGDTREKIGYDDEEYRGFIGLQIALNKAIIHELTGIEPGLQIQTQQLPYPSHNYQGNKPHYALPMVIVIGFVFMVPSVIRNIISEKETGIKELMKMMGLPNWIHWVGWMINSLVALTISITIVTLLVFIPFVSSLGGLLTNADFTLFWVVLHLFVIAATALCFLISTFFRRPAVAITFGIVLYLLAYIPLSQIMTRNPLSFPGSPAPSVGSKLAACVLPSMALDFALMTLAQLENFEGARWSNLFSPLNPEDEFCIGYACLMLILDTILYTGLAIYLENVIPSEFGLRKPWYYIIKVFDFRKAPRGQVAPAPIVVTAEKKGPFEPDPTNLKAGVVIQNLRKEFGKHKVAVNMEGTLKMYDGQITALLGHNGAGKTTTLSILTGLFAPTSGTATINGFDIREDMDKVRMNLGLCPQHNTIFEKLTVREHLIFFGMVKGLTKMKADEELRTLLWRMQFLDKMDTQAKNLSGGQKRKLCLAMALIGGTKVVILDEPTSGMDPEVRRAIWNLLLEMRGERTIILTTHFMEEADILGDRIAIMAEGEVKCCGTPHFLKKYYGAGYTLKLTVVDTSVVPRILELVQNSIPNSYLKEGHGGNPLEVDITIPTDGLQNSVFPGLFSALNGAKNDLGIQTIGLSLATMDDIFVKVGEESVHKIEENQSPIPDVNLTEVETRELEEAKRPYTGMNLLLQQFHGILRKRMMTSFRKWSLYFSQVLLPVVLLILAILLSNSLLLSRTSSGIIGGLPSFRTDLSISSYRNPVTLFQATSNNLADAYQQSVGGPSTRVLVPRLLIEELLAAGRRDLRTYRNRYIVAGDLSNSTATALYSSIPNHALSLSVNIMSNTILRLIAPNQRYRIQTAIHPFRYETEEGISRRGPAPNRTGIGLAQTVGLLFATFLTIGLAILTASYVVAPIEEKLCKVKQLQLMTMNPAVYWGGGFLWDFGSLVITALLMTACLPIFQTGSLFTADHGAGTFFLIMISYGFAGIAFSYVFSTFAASVPGGFSLVTTLHIFSGVILTLPYYVSDPNGRSSSANEIIRGILRVFPMFSGGTAIMRFAFTSITYHSCASQGISQAGLKAMCATALPGIEGCCPCDNRGITGCLQQKFIWSTTVIVVDSTGRTEPYESSIPGIVQDITCLLATGVIYMILLMLIEFGFLKKVFACLSSSNPAEFVQKSAVDDDVQTEKDRIAELVRLGQMGQDALVVEDLCKGFGSFAAVSGLNFGVHYGECFGLLGVNGAGKTTAFRMLTGDEIPSAGNAWNMGLSLSDNRSDFLSRIGYCPQFDGIVGVLTGKEMIDLFGRLRGIREGQIAGETTKWLFKLGLLESANVQCRKYSGGMKRRLCAGIALIGDPPIILFDEPTSGVDPIGRRQFWKVIESLRHIGQAVVLTSHSMDECEALCSRLAIMVNGQFQCLGGVQHLKAKFAQGFLLVITLKENSSDAEEKVNENGQDVALSNDIYNTFQPSILRDRHERTLEFQILGRELGWGAIFERMEKLSEPSDTRIEEYSVTETTLEEVFLSFARMQYPEREVKVSWFKKCITSGCCN